MEIRVLKYFLAAAREENITKAAESLFISQPALSRQLMQLEEELGVKLFVRGQHSITLTEEGMFFRRRAQEIVDLAEKTKTEFKGDVYKRQAYIRAVSTYQVDSRKNQGKATIKF